MDKDSLGNIVKWVLVGKKKNKNKNKKQNQNLIITKFT